MNHGYIFHHVDLHSIQFVNNKNDVEFVFHNCTEHNSDYCGSLTCVNVLSFNMKTYFDDDSDTHFPRYVLDVFFENHVEPGKLSQTIGIEGEAHSMSIICEKFEVSKV